MCSLMPFTKLASHANGSGWNDPSRALQTIRVSFQGTDDEGMTKFLASYLC